MESLRSFGEDISDWFRNQDPKTLILPLVVLLITVAIFFLLNYLCPCSCDHAEDEVKEDGQVMNTVLEKYWSSDVVNIDYDFKSLTVTKKYPTPPFDVEDETSISSKSLH